MIWKHRLAALIGLSLVAIGVGQLVGCQPAEKTRTVVLVETAYPGADAQTVADTVAAPIEQQVNGVEKMVHMRSQSRSDGSYLLAVEFAEGMDPAIALTLVQNRASLATPVLPEVVKRGGMTIKQAAPGVLLICFISSDGRFDERDSSNYATINLRDELARLPGVEEIAIIPESHQGIRILLDPEKLAARNLTVGDVAAAIRQRNAKMASSPTDEPPTDDKTQRSPFLMTAPLSADAEQFEDLIVKFSSGQLIRLKDVAKVELGGGESRNFVVHQGKRVVALAIWPVAQTRAEAVRDAVRKQLSELGARLPEGMSLDTSFDFAPNQSTPSQYVIVDVTLPNGISAERTREAFTHCEQIVQKIEGVQDSLAFSENPFDPFRNQPGLLLRLAPAEGKPDRLEAVKREIRTRIAEEAKEMEISIRDFSEPGGGYSVDFAICGPTQEGVYKMADKLREQLSAKGKMTDVRNPSAEKMDDRIEVKIDRAKANAAGLSVSDVLDTVPPFRGPVQVGEVRRFGKTWPIVMQMDARPDDKLSELEIIKLLTVRDSQGKMIPLTSLAEVRQSMAPAVVERLDMDPMREITAEPADGASSAELRTQCESLAAEVRTELKLPAGYHVIWLRPISAK